jgi:hypothetical protein
VKRRHPAAVINVHLYTTTYINEHQDEKMHIKRSYSWKRKRTRKSGTRYKEVGAPISLGAIRLISINKANGELWNIMGYMRNRGIGKR